ncbi:periplasmic heavy metal sensor, partial [Rhodoplanes roseus]
MSAEPIMAGNGWMGRSGGLRIVLFVSLGVNLFLAGSWVGTLMRPGWPPPPPPRPMQEIARELQGRIAPDSMAKVEALMGEIDTRIRSGPGDPRRMDDRLRELLSADRFDVEAFTTTVDRFLSARSENDKVIAKRIAEVVVDFSPADRKVLAEVVLR